MPEVRDWVNLVVLLVRGEGSRTCAQGPHLVKVVEGERSAVQIKGALVAVVLLLVVVGILASGGGGEPPRLQGIKPRTSHAGG